MNSGKIHKVSYIILEQGLFSIQSPRIYLIEVNIDRDILFG